MKIFRGIMTGSSKRADKCLLDSFTANRTHHIKGVYKAAAYPPKRTSAAGGCVLACLRHRSDAGLLGKALRPPEGGLRLQANPPRTRHAGVRPLPAARLVFAFAQPTASPPFAPSAGCNVPTLSLCSKGNFICSTLGAGTPLPLTSFAYRGNNVGVRLTLPPSLFSGLFF